MGELQHEAFQFAFNGFLKVAFQGSRVTSDAGLLLVRELDERLGLEALISEYLNDSRQGLNTQFSLADLLLGRFTGVLACLVFRRSTPSGTQQASPPDCAIGRSRCPIIGYVR